MLSEGLSTLVGNVLTLTGAIIAMALLDWRLALATLVILPPTMVVSRWFQTRSHTAFADVRTRISALTAHIAESLAGMAVIQSYNREDAFRGQFSELNRANQRSNQHAQNLSSLFFPAIELFGVIAMVAVLALGARLYEDGTLTIGTLIAFIGLLALVFQPLQELSELYGQVQSAAAAMEKITTVLDEETDIASPPDARLIERVEGHVALENVTFAYGRDPVLHGIDLDIPAGSCVALVGMSGGGKSTLARLVGRFYDPREGTVRVDGNDLREIDLVHYRRQLGVVLQDPFLFAGTIADNLRFAAPGATDEHVEETARAIGLDRVAARFSEGLEHAVREGGSGLSAGERQLISIGRALLADPRILILDEATSNIDRPDGGADREGARPPAARADVDRDRPPPGDRAPRRRDRGARSRPHRRARQRGRADGRGRPVRGARARSRSACAGGRRLMIAVASGYVGILTFELHFPGESSLKGKRKHLLALKSHLQQRAGASVAEVDHHDVWQRARLTVTLVDREAGGLDERLDRCERLAYASGAEVGPFTRIVVTPEDLT